MPLLIVAPLHAARVDLARLESLRRRHDPHHAIIPAHVTLVFPFDAGLREPAARHMTAVAAQPGVIALRLASFVAVRDHDDRQSHVFAIPDQGRAEIEDLHDALYSGPLAEALRSDIAYIPHVTVGARAHHDEAEDLVRELGRIGMTAQLTELELISFEDGVVTTLERAPLPG